MTFTWQTQTVALCFDPLGCLVRKRFGRLMDKHGVSAHRVVNNDETSCRLLPVHRIGWCRRCVKQAQLQGNTRGATTFTVALSMDRGALNMLVQIVHAGKRDAVLPAQPWPPHATLNVMNPGKEGQSWILLCNVASIHTSAGTLAAMEASLPHWPYSAASRAASRRKRAPLLPAPSSTARWTPS